MKYNIYTIPNYRSIICNSCSPSKHKFPKQITLVSHLSVGVSCIVCNLSLTVQVSGRKTTIAHYSSHINGTSKCVIPLFSLENNRRNFVFLYNKFLNRISESRSSICLKQRQLLLHEMAQDTKNITFNAAYINKT